MVLLSSSKPYEGAAFPVRPVPSDRGKELSENCPLAASTPLRERLLSNFSRSLSEVEAGWKSHLGKGFDVNFGDTP